MADFGDTSPWGEDVADTIYTSNRPRTLSHSGKAPMNIESTDYDMHETPALNKWFAEQEKDMPQRQRMKDVIRYCLLFAVGVAAALCALFIDFGIKWGFKLRHYLIEDVLIGEGFSLGVQYLVFVGMSVVFGMCAAALVCYVEPLAGGSGIPEIKCHLNGVDMYGVVHIKTLIAKSVGIIGSVCAGLPVGKEGPMIHSGAILGWVISHAKLGPLKRPYRMEEECRNFITAGAAAGVAAAFGAPLGGVLFAVEEGATHMNATILVRTFVPAFVAAMFVRALAGPLVKGTTWGYLGGEVPVDFGIMEVVDYRIWNLPFIVLVAIGGGLLGGLYNYLNKQLTLVRMRYIGPKGHRRFLEAIFVVFFISTCSFFLPIWFSGGRSSDVLKDELNRALYWGEEGDAISLLFHSDNVFFPAGQLLFFGVYHFLIGNWVYGLGVSSGLFLPTLLTGAAFGRAIGQGLAIAGITQGHSIGMYAAVGSVAMLGGVARITISLAAIIVECTGAEAYLGIPLMLATVFAKWTGDLFNPGLYDVHIELKHVPLLEQEPGKEIGKMQVSDIMVQYQDIVRFPPVPTVKEIFSTLQSCEHHGFPVVHPGTESFVGLVKRSTLLHLLFNGKEYGLFQATPELSVPAPALPFKIIARSHPDCPSLEEVEEQLSPEDYTARMDLRPHMADSVFTISECSSARRCYKLFREMGMRHLPVVGMGPPLRGLITRTDLILSEEDWVEEVEDEGDDDDEEEYEDAIGPERE